jgi:hypothetical protein
MTLAEDANRFARDERGVMMVIGAVAGAFLIGAVWFIWGVGQAAVFRETMQSAADATAYQMSVYDARGMNIIAMINLIMSVVLTVYVIIRLLQAIFVAVNIISCIFGAIFNPICDATTVAEPEVTELVETAARITSTILTALSVTESGISIVWPFFAAGTSGSVSNDYAPTVAGSAGVGTSNVPLQAATDLAGQVASSSINLDGEGKAVSMGNIKKAFSAENGVFCNYDGKFLLPTESDDYANLCARAGANVAYAFGGLANLFAGDFIGGALSSFFNQTVAPIVGALVGQFTAFFCEDDAGALISIAESLVKGSGNGDPQDGLDKKCEQKAKSAQQKSGDKTAKPAGDVAAATKQCKGTLERAKRASNKTKGTGAFAEACSKTLYSGATMLDQNFQNWGFSFGSYTDTSGAIVGTANGKGGGAPVAASNGADMQIAQSEFYYEPKSEGETADAEKANVNASVKSLGDGLNSGLDNYMWNMRWRARLRRVRAPEVEVGAGLASILGKIGGKASSTSKSKAASKGIDKATEILTGAIKDKGTITVGGSVVKAEMVH